MTDKTDKTGGIYFKNLNTIRFIAAFMVIVHHVEQIKDMFHLPNLWDNRVVFIIGKLGVILFFVLSGFLISYLLFKEQEITRTISIKDFYIRRILRIWPLYFLIILSALFILPEIDFFTLPGFEQEIVQKHLLLKILLYVFFLPNLLIHVLGIIPYAAQTWSIGAEEQFYLIWPILNKYFRKKWILLFAVILLYLAIKIFLDCLPDTKYTQVGWRFWASSPIDCMAIGGIFALLAHETRKVTDSLKKILFNSWFQWAVLILSCTMIGFGLFIPYFHFEFYAVLFGILIFNFACNPRPIFSMEIPFLNYLGKISYGIYMYHPIVIVISIKLLLHFGMLNNYLLYPLVLVLVVLFSSLSYRFFEKWFIKRKIRYSKVLSGDNVGN